MAEKSITSTKPEVVGRVPPKTKNVRKQNHLSPPAKERTPNPVRRAISRDAALRAARGLFVTRGYLATSVDDIAREAGLSKGGLYFHFSDKSKLLAELLLQSSNLYSGIIDTLNNSTLDPRQRIAVWVNEVSRLAAKEPELMLLPILVSIEFLGKEDGIERLVKTHYDAMYRGLMHTLRQGRKLGMFRSSSPVREEAATLAALADGALLEWLRRKNQLNGEALVRALRTFVLDGVSISPQLSAPRLRRTKTL